MSDHKLAIIILNWNGLAYTRACLQALLDDATTAADIFVLDNGSTHDEAAALRLKFDGRITIERSEKNLGFTGGNNYLLRQLLAKRLYGYIVLLNQDAVVEPGCLHRLTNFLDEQKDVAVCGPLVLDQASDRVQSCGATISRWTGKITSRYQSQARTDIPPQAQTVDCVIGNCFMMRVAALETIGLLDDGYFAYYEEADWCVRARQQGFSCAVVPAAVIRHAKSGGFRTYLITRNMIWFQKTHAAALQLFFFWLYFWAWYLPERLKKGSRWQDLWRGTRDGWLKRKPHAV